MIWWMNQASRLQASVREGEITRLVDYEPEDVAQATVHMRQDIVLLVSLMDSANAQLRQLRWAAFIIAAASCIIALKIIF
jgi:hypothetical protein